MAQEYMNFATYYGSLPPKMPWVHRKKDENHQKDAHQV